MMMRPGRSETGGPAPTTARDSRSSATTSATSTRSPISSIATWDPQVADALVDKAADLKDRGEDLPPLAEVISTAPDTFTPNDDTR
jgi:hypothetical protein